ncbi:KTSC domain-containing protein [Bacillus bingmayongensis]|uniref:KTSC domain-containing protein n=1 Tax=Bacillus bingmayongensis TaxID=1150157 RepID=A0ABU5K040_9BACI|nr:KTSC domain-containing protein [Bacillus bingmayongensis]MBY0599236.1 KTSC domain-containing protein [Bacillus bingmayongensis]MDZ5609025.1 KTSC domain-containing protein [Bacillus pseudomycoides]
MTLYPVISRNLVAIGYNPSSMILRIEFRNGTYDFYDVPESIYEGLRNAQSKSYYHDTYIRNSYRHTKI